MNDDVTNYGGRDTEGKKKVLKSVEEMEKGKE